MLSNSTCWSTFPDEEVELYSLGRMEGSARATFEEHLLVCEECRARVVEAELFVSILRTALGIEERNSAPPPVVIVPSSR